MIFKFRDIMLSSEAGWSMCPYSHTSALEVSLMHSEFYVTYLLYS